MPQSLAQVQPTADQVEQEQSKARERAGRINHTIAQIVAEVSGNGNTESALRVGIEPLDKSKWNAERSARIVRAEGLKGSNVRPFDIASISGFDSPSILLSTIEASCKAWQKANGKKGGAIPDTVRARAQKLVSELSDPFRSELEAFVKANVPKGSPLLSVVFLTPDGSIVRLKLTDPDGVKDSDRRIIAEMAVAEVEKRFADCQRFTAEEYETIQREEKKTKKFISMTEDEIGKAIEKEKKAQMRADARIKLMESLRTQRSK